MKVKGLSITLPVCDLRPIVHEGAIVDCFREGPLYGNTFLRGFGKATERFKLRTPWRPTDTIYLDCRKAISLPDVIPIDKKHAYRIIRRVYCDSSGVVRRFELGFFLHPKHTAPPSRASWQDYAKAFWTMQVRINVLGRRENFPLYKALGCLVEHFVRGTTPHPVDHKLQVPLCHSLTPQLQVSMDIGDVVDPEQAVPLDSEYSTFLQAEALNVQGRCDPVDAICLFCRQDIDLRWRRLIRAHISWLHADLEALSFLVQRYRSEEAPPAVVACVEKLASGLLAAPGISDVDRIAVLSLLKVAGELQANRRSRLAAAIEVARFPSLAKTKVRESLQANSESFDRPASRIDEQLRNVGRLHSEYCARRMVEVASQLTDVEVGIALGRGSGEARRKRDGLLFAVKVIDSALLDPEQISCTPDVWRTIEANEPKVRALAEDFHPYYTGPSEKSVVGYLEQFGNAKWVELALMLLSHVQFFAAPRLGEIFREYVTRLSKGTRRKAVFIPLGGPRDSGPLMTYAFSKGLPGEESDAVQFNDLGEAIRIYEPGEVIPFFVDDNVGSGEQATRIFQEWFDAVRDEHKHVVSLDEDGRRWLRNCPVVNYFVIAGFAEGMHDLTTAVNALGVNLKVEPAILTRESEGCFSPASSVFRSKDDRAEAREMARAIGYQLFQDKVHWTEQKKRERALGYGNSQKLIVFSHNTPPSTLPILWKAGSFNGCQWTPLFPRR